MSGSHTHAIAASNVFDGVTVLPDSAVIIEGAHVAEVKPRGELPASMPVVALPDDAWLAPGFIDVQVNGGGDVLFNDTPTAAGINAIAAAHRRYGTTGLLADADQRYVRQDARCHGGSAECCGGEPERARHSLRRAVHVAREARRARSGDVPRT